MKKVVFVFLIALLFPGILAAQEIIPTYFNRITLDGVDELARALSDPEVSVEQKRLAVNRMSELSRQLPNSNVQPSRLYNPLLGALRPEKNVKDHHVLRIAICEALRNFADLDGSAQLIGPLGRVMMDSDEHEEVRAAAARTLADFRKDRSAAVEALISALNKELDRGPNSNNTSITSVICVSLGTLRDKRALVPLMKVVQSSFPNQTKRNAKTALESLDWGR